MSYFVCDIELPVKVKEVYLKDMMRCELIWDKPNDSVYLSNSSIGGVVGTLSVLTSVSICNIDTLQVSKVNPNILALMLKNNEIIGEYDGTIYCMSVDGYRLSKVVNVANLNIRYKDYHIKDVTLLENVIFFESKHNIDSLWFKPSILFMEYLYCFPYPGYIFLCDYILYLVRNFSKEVLNILLDIHEGYLVVYGIEDYTIPNKSGNAKKGIRRAGKIVLLAENNENLLVFLAKYKLGKVGK